MRRRVLMGIVLSALWSASGGLPAHAVVLRYAPRVGEVHKQKVTMSGRMETMMGAAAQPMRMEITGEMNYSEKALSQTDTLTRVQTDLLGGKATIAMGSHSRPVDMPTGHIVVDSDRRGHVVKVVEVDLPGAEKMMGAGAENFQNWSQFVAFPEGDVKVNDTWTDKVSIPAAQGMPSIEMAFKCTLLDLTTFQGRKCAKMRVAFNGPFQMDLSQAQGVPQGTEGAIEATMQGDIVWYYDHESCVYVYGEGTVGMDMKMSMGGSNTPAGNMTTKMLMNIKTALQP